MLAIDFEQKKNWLVECLTKARAHGIEEAEIALRIDKGFSTTVRMGNIDTIEHHHDRALSITAYVNQRKGCVSTNDLSSESVLNSLKQAKQIAQSCAQDPYAGLADPETMAYHYPDVPLYYPWSIEPEQAIAEASRWDDYARRCPGVTNVEGITMSTNEGAHFYGNTHNFVGYYPSSLHSFTCVLLAADNGLMQRDYAYTLARDPNDLHAFEEVTQQAAERARARLGARSLPTQKAPVLFKPEVARSLWKQVLRAINGHVLYRRASFLLEQLHQVIGPSWLSLEESPHLPKAMGSAPFDGDGVATQSKFIIKNGELVSYLLDAYSARKLSMTNTGNAGGCHNLVLHGPTQSLPEMIQHMDKGLIVTELLGHGVDLVTGNYSQGAAGFWVEHGEIQFPVHEVTIAGQLSDMLKHIVAMGSDVDCRSAIRTGSVLIEEMTIAGQ